MSIEKIAENMNAFANKVQTENISKIQNIKSPLNSLNSINLPLPKTTVDVFEKQGGAKSAADFIQYIKSAIYELFH